MSTANSVNFDRMVWDLFVAAWKAHCEKETHRETSGLGVWKPEFVYEACRKNALVFVTMENSHDPVLNPGKTGDNP